MNPPEFPAEGGASPASSKKELQLQGPRPPPLKVSKESHKINKKPPRPPAAAAAHHHRSSAAQEESQQQQQQREPVIIYSVSPKVIHVTASDFMDVVQRLTGPSSSGDEPAAAGAGDVSPAARLASIEKTSPSEKERAVQSGGDEEMMWMLEEGGVEVGQFPGVLSPAPATLPPIPPEYFSPVVDPQTAPFLSDFWSANYFLASPSPSGLLSAAVLSPQPSPDLFNIFND